MKLKTNNRFFVLPFLASAILAGCGGGSDSPSAQAVTPVATASAEGVYGGTLTGSRSTEFQMLILENGEFWSMYGTSTTSAFGIAGFVQGAGTSSNGKFTSSNAKDFGVNPALPGTVNATYDAATKTIAGSVASTTGTATFTSAPLTGSLYDYNMPASLKTVTGSWSATSLNGEAVALTVSSNGAFIATSALGCKFAGTVTPRPSGKNVFNVSFTFGAAPCALPGQAGTGIALTYPLAGGKTQLLVAATDGQRVNGSALTAISSPVVTTPVVTTPVVTTPVVTTPVVTTPVATTPVVTTPTSTKTCYIGPLGGTYTLTASGNKNYGGC